MRIRDLKLNGAKIPLNTDGGRIFASWKVDETPSRKQIKSKIELLSENQILWQKEGALDALNEEIQYETEPRKDYQIKVSVWGDQGDTASAALNFFMGKQKEAWTAKWIGTDREDPFHPLFIRRFRTKEEKPVSAKLHICGLGLFEAYLNGNKIGGEYLTPYYNHYDHEKQALTFDVKDMLGRENMLEILLGNGWYKGRFGMNQQQMYGDRFALIAELHLRYADGTKEVVQTDGNWTYKGSDIEESDIYDGETLNRLLWKDKENPEKKAVILEMDKRILTDRFSLPAVIKDKIKVQKVIHTPAGETVLDMGQNFTGWIEFVNDQKSGQTVVFDFGEVLQDGNFYNENYRTAKSRFVYISDGRNETVRPHFTFFGFRYIRINGWQGEPDPENFMGCVLYSDLERTGYFKCDNDKVNRLYENTVWGMKSNFLDMPTDCPQRDERLGWTGDAQVFAPTASLHMDTKVFFQKFLRDLRHYQKEMKGAVPVCIPEAEAGGNHMTSSVWSDIAAILPALLYQVYGDIRQLAANYPMMKEWVEFVFRSAKEQGEGHYLWDFGFHFGDWLALDGPDEQSCQGGTEEAFIASIYYYNSVKLTKEAALYLKADERTAQNIRNICEEDAKRYKELEEQIYQAVLAEYFTPSGRLALNTQTAYILALHYGIYRDRDKVAAQFRKKLKEDKFKMSSGFVGAPLYCQTLCENGMEETAYQMLLNEEYPGWLYCVKLGATTIWERWNSILPDGKISGTGMNSLNHYSYGNIAQFLYENIAGIKKAEAGYRKVLFEPCINAGLRHAEASYDSARGRYAISWTLMENGEVKISCEAPFEGEAVLRLPRYSGGEKKLGAGKYEFQYMPETSFLVRFTEESTMKEILSDGKGAEYISTKAPAIAGICTMGGASCMEMKLKEVLAVAETMCGMSKTEAETVLAEIKNI